MEGSGCQGQISGQPGHTASPCRVSNWPQSRDPSAFLRQNRAPRGFSYAATVRVILWPFQTRFLKPSALDKRASGRSCQHNGLMQIDFKSLWGNSRSQTMRSRRHPIFPVYIRKVPAGILTVCGAGFLERRRTGFRRVENAGSCRAGKRAKTVPNLVGHGDKSRDQKWHRKSLMGHNAERCSSCGTTLGGAFA